MIKNELMNGLLLRAKAETADKAGCAQHATELTSVRQNHHNLAII